VTTYFPSLPEIVAIFFVAHTVSLNVMVPLEGPSAVTVTFGLDVVRLTGHGLTFRLPVVLHLVSLSHVVGVRKFVSGNVLCGSNVLCGGGDPAPLHPAKIVMITAGNDRINSFMLPYSFILTH
jgi:hypothetical protein